MHARQDFNQGRISGDQLREVEDRAVLQALDLQRQVGIDIYTEGEYRRSGWSNAVRESVEGLVPVEGSPRNTAEKVENGSESRWPYSQAKMVVLGLISSKQPELESIDDLRRRIDEAAKYVPMENLAVAPNAASPPPSWAIS